MPEDQALQQLHAILARPEYQFQSEQSVWAQLLMALEDAVRSVLEQLVTTAVRAGTGREGWIGLVALSICLLLLAGGGVYLVRAVRLSVHRETSARVQSLAERRERSERLWRTAQQLAASGEWSEAVRVVYLSALYALDERALLHVESSLTNREHVRELQRIHPDLAAQFAEVVDRYDRLRYGRLGASESTFTDLSAVVARAREAAFGGAQAQASVA